MTTHADKTSKNQNAAVAVRGGENGSSSLQAFELVDNRPEMIAQRKLISSIHESSKIQPIQQRSTNPIATIQKQAVIQLGEVEARSFARMIGLEDGDYEFINEDYSLESGNCHGYTLGGDKNASIAQDVESFVANYKEILKGSAKVTVFMAGSELAHSAKGHGADCIHKVGERGPLIKCAASVYAKALGYTATYQLPDDLDTFEGLK